MLKRIIHWSIMLLLPIAAVAYLLYCLETYYRFVHNDSATAVQFIALIFLITEYIIWRKGHRQHYGYTVVAILSVIILSAVFYVGGRIPFCVECDQVTAEDLGLLRHWIEPMENSK